MVEKKYLVGYRGAPAELEVEGLVEQLIAGFKYGAWVA
jgi:hypothetical protein